MASKTGTIYNVLMIEPTTQLLPQMPLVVEV